MEYLHPALFLLQCWVKQNCHCTGCGWKRFLQERDSGKGAVPVPIGCIGPTTGQFSCFFEKTCLRKNRTGRGGGGEKSEKLQCEVREGGRGGAALGAGAGIPCSLWGGPWTSRYFPAVHEGTPFWNRWMLPEGTAACGEPTPKQNFYLRDFSWWERPHCKRGNCEKEGVVQKKYYILTHLCTCSSLFCPGAGLRSLEWKTDTEF